MGENTLVKPTTLALLLARQYIQPKTAVVDATAGSGADTAALAEMLGEDGKLYAFDIQEEALIRTERRLKDEGFEARLREGKIRLILDSHAAMSTYVTEEVSLVLFNLGYLPGGNKEVTTCKTASLEAVRQALALLRSGGAVIVVVYDGHPAGAEEKRALLSFAGALDKSIYHVVYFQMWNQPDGAPEVIGITKKKYSETA